MQISSDARKIFDLVKKNINKTLGTDLTDTQVLAALSFLGTRHKDELYAMIETGQGIDWSLITKAND